MEYKAILKSEGKWQVAEDEERELSIGNRDLCPHDTMTMRYSFGYTNWRYMYGSGERQTFLPGKKYTWEEIKRMTEDE